jgi:hypothetical protein
VTAARGLAPDHRRALQHEQWDPGPPLHEVLGEVEQQRLRPLDVVDREHHRLLRGERGEQAPHHEKDLLRQGRRARESHRAAR